MLLRYLQMSYRNPAKAEQGKVKKNSLITPFGVVYNFIHSERRLTVLFIAKIMNRESFV